MMIKHIYIPNEDAEETLVLFHGTGGDEYDLIEFAKALEIKVNILSLRGEVNENGQNRFFKRKAMGIFDEVDLTLRTHQIHEDIIELSKEYSFDLSKTYALGYSNGANMIASILFIYNDLFFKSALLHPMFPIEHNGPNLENHEVFISAAQNDSICPFNKAIRIKEHLESKNSKVRLFETYQGHQLTQEEFRAIKNWFKKVQ
jgi:phospholipase/carboxylesterase